MNRREDALETGARADPGHWGGRREGAVPRGGGVRGVCPPKPHGPPLKGVVSAAGEPASGHARDLGQGLRTPKAKRQLSSTGPFSISLRHCHVTATY